MFLEKLLKFISHPNKEIESILLELMEYFNSFPDEEVFLVTKDLNNWPGLINVITPEQFASTSPINKILIFDADITNIDKLQLADAVKNSSLTIIFDKKNDLDKHERILLHNRLSNQFIGVNKDIKNVTISFHGRLFDIPPREKLRLKKVLTIISTHNDEDIIGQVLEYLIAQEMDILLLENWSTDKTPKIAQRMAHKYPGRITVEKFPKDAPSPDYMWPEMLFYKANNRISKKYDWLIHYDSDEIRISPWINRTLLESISFVDELGYNAINFSLADFRPTTEGFSEQDDPEAFFDHFELRDTPGCFLQIKAFKNFGQNVDLSSSFGHVAVFEGRKVFPIKFLLKHYPLRSTISARKKIFQDRRPRYAKKNRAKGAHIHYDKYTPDHIFIWDSSELNRFENTKEVYRNYLLQFLTGVGIRKK